MRTPGKWEVWYDEGGGPDDGSATAYLFEARADEHTFDEHVANAKLMSDAPLLLQALIDLLDGRATVRLFETAVRRARQLVDKHREG